jgi:hypothetical protein
MASNDALVLSPRSAALEKQRETIVLVRWALILTSAYLVLLGHSTAAPGWLGPLLIAAFLGSNVIVGRLPRPYFAQQTFKIGVAVMDTCFIAASLWAGGQLSVELLLLCLGVLVMAIAGLSLGIIAAVTIGLSVASVGVAWVGGLEIVWQSSVLLRVPLLLGAALVFALLVEGQSARRVSAAPVSDDDLISTLATHVTSQHEALRRYHAAMADHSSGAARDAIEEVALHNRQMAQKLARWQPVVQATRSAA